MRTEGSARRDVQVLVRGVLPAVGILEFFTVTRNFTHRKQNIIRKVLRRVLLKFYRDFHHHMLLPNREYWRIIGAQTLIFK